MLIRFALSVAVSLLIASCAWSGEVNNGTVFSGTYEGSYFGDDTGSLSLQVDNRSNLLWEGESMAKGGFSIRGSVQYTDGRWLLRGSTDDGISFLGFLEADGRFSGTWENPGEGQSGNFELKRLRQ